MLDFCVLEGRVASAELSELTTTTGSFINPRNKTRYADGVKKQPPTRQLWFVLLPVDAAFLRNLIDGSDGARALSQLRIMGLIMQRLHEHSFANESEKIMLPCEHFDLMGGSGTGG